MNNKQIPPFYFPTTVIFVDDSIDFLANLSLKLNFNLAFQLYDSPEHALAMLNSENNRSTPIERLFSRYHHTDDLPLTHHVIDVNLDKIHREVYNEFRFEQVSVVVVDYEMPSINGLDFCRCINNPAIKKVLLTGKADEMVAIRAFNEGIIDRFIMKQDKDVISILNQSILELQREYFSQTERMLADALSIGKHSFLHDPLFEIYFRELCDKLKIVEFYLCSEPDGMLMLSEEGAVTLLLVPNEDELLSQYEIAYEQGAPQELLSALKSNQIVPYFWQTGGYYVPECREWRTFLYPATMFKGKKCYYFAIVRDPVLYKTDAVYSYREFLNDLDQLQWTGSGRP